MPPATHRAQPANAAPARAADTGPDAALLDDALERAVTNLDGLAGRCRTELEGAAAQAMRRSALMGKSIELLERAIEPMMPLLMRLMNTRLGFLTDRTKEGEKYPPDIVKRCAVEAVLRGATLAGNEFNILAGNCYLTQEYFARRVAELPGLADLELAPGVPGPHNGQMVVRVRAEWTMNGKRQCLYGADGQPGRVFAVAQNSRSNADNSTGKAVRKALKAVLEKATGKRCLDDDPPEPTPRRQATAPATLDPPAGAEVPPAALPREPGVEPEGT